MTETGTKVLETIGAALPTMPRESIAYLTGYGEGLIAAQEAQKEKEKQKEQEGS